MAVPIDREEGFMRRQQTIAKATRERTVRERRERKQEKKRLRKLEAAMERGEIAGDGTKPTPPVH